MEAERLFTGGSLGCHNKTVHTSFTLFRLLAWDQTDYGRTQILLTSRRGLR
jgi:hypothetical protein